MNKDVLLFICGIHIILFAIFHVAFWKFFNWRNDLKKLILANRAIMQISNILLIYIFLFIALLCFFFTKELYTTNIGKALLCGVSLFWFIRTIEQFIFLRINNKWVHILTALFIAGTIVFLLPVLL